MRTTVTWHVALSALTLVCMLIAYALVRRPLRGTRSGAADSRQKAAAKPEEKKKEEVWVLGTLFFGVGVCVVFGALWLAAFYFLVDPRPVEALARVVADKIEKFGQGDEYTPAQSAHTPQPPALPEKLKSPAPENAGEGERPKSP